jgi:aspartyl/glutamyl-tRNA(Asn/Gln) amidotransferase C subunit
VRPTREDVERAAALGRLPLAAGAGERLHRELAAIAAHLEPLLAVDTDGISPVEGVGAAGMPLRTDAGPPLPLDRAPDAFAPPMRAGHFLVPPPDGDGRS